MLLQLCAFSLLLVGCSRSPEPAKPCTAPVARIGKVQLCEDDLQRAMQRDPGASRARFETPEARKELVDGLVRFELLAQAAERAGLTKDPDAVHALQQIAVTKLVNQTLGTSAAPESITQADVERDYQARKASEFTLPEGAHVRHLRVADKALAERLATQARALAPEDDAGFASLAEKSSQDDATRTRGGDLGVVDKNSKLPNALVSAALALKTPGDVAGPLETDGGWEVVRLVARRAAAVSPLSSVQESIRQRLYRERRAQALDELIAKLRRETPVEVVDAKASK
jgi:peptidyl-prolyl cis-trans isomerase C